MHRRVAVDQVELGERGTWTRPTVAACGASTSCHTEYRRRASSGPYHPASGWVSTDTDSWASANPSRIPTGCPRPVSSSASPPGPSVVMTSEAGPGPSHRASIRTGSRRHGIRHRTRGTTTRG